MTKAPETDIVEQLWSLVETHNVKTIMTFHDDTDTNEKVTYEHVFFSIQPSLMSVYQPKKHNIIYSASTS